MFDLSYISGIDGSLPWVFNYFAASHFSLGRHTLFPHGPLAFLLYPLPMQNNLAVCMLVRGVLSFSFNLSLFRISTLLLKEGYALVVVIALLLNAIMDIQLLLVGLTLSLMVLFYLSGRTYYLLLGLFFSVFNLLIKTYGGIICLSLVGVETLRFLIVRKNFKIVACGFLLALVFFYAFWLAMYGTFQGALIFLRGQYELSLDNSEAVALYTVVNWFPIAVCLLSLVLIPFVSKDAVVKHTGLLMLLPFFAAWKHAMARADDSHVPGFLNFLLFFCLFLWLIQREKKITGIVLSFVALSAFMLNMGETGYATQKSITILKPYNLYNLIVNYKELCASKNWEAVEINRSKILPDTIRKMIGNNTADIYPWNHTIIAVNNLNWSPRPVIQGYAAYTGWLDAQDAAHIRSGNAAQFMIWEICPQVYESPNHFGSIDQRYVLNDEPQYMLGFFSHYSLCFKNDDYLLFEKRSKPLFYTTEYKDTQKAGYNSWVNVPKSGPDGLMRIRLKIKKSAAGLLKSFFYKAEALFIDYELEDKTTRHFRIVPRNAAEGIWINPFVFDPGTRNKEPRVKRVRITCPEEQMLEPFFTYAFEEIHFKGQDLQEEFFGKNEKPAMASFSFAGSNENDNKLLQNQSWMESSDIAKIPTARKLGLPAYSLRPGGFSGQYSFVVDKENVPATLHSVNVEVSASVKATNASGALFLISQDQQDGKGFWLPQSLADFIIHNNEWNRANFSKNIPLQNITPDEPVKVYIWNNDPTQSIIFDSLKVRVSASP